MSAGVGLFALSLGAGLGVCLALGVPHSRRWWPTLIGVAPFVGLLASGAAALALVVVGVEPHPVAVAIVVVGMGLAAWQVRTRVSLAPWPDRAGGTRAGTIAELAILVAYAPVIVAILRLAAVSGPGWDGWAIWGLKAEALGLDADLGGPVFTDPFYVGSQQAYPILQPALVASGARIGGGHDPTLTDLVGTLGLLFLGVAVWGVLRTVVPRWLAAAVGLAALSSWPLVDNAIEGYADALLAAAVAFGVLCLLVALLTRASVTLALGLGSLALAPLVKSEGLLFAVAALVALGVATLVDRRDLRPLVLPAVATLLPGLAWGVWLGGRDTVIDSGELVRPGALWADRARAGETIDALAAVLAEAWRPAIVLAVGGVGLALLGRRYAGAALYVVWAGLGLAGLVLTYVIARTEIGWHLEMSADRVVLTIGLASGIVGPLLAVDGWRALRSPSGSGDADRSRASRIRRAHDGSAQRPTTSTD